MQHPVNANVETIGIAFVRGIGLLAHSWSGNCTRGTWVFDTRVAKIPAMAGSNVRTTGIDQESLEQKLKASAPRLRALIKSRLRSRARSQVTVEDVLQDVWIRAHRDRLSFRSDRPDALDRWLTSLTQHSLLDAIKSDMRLKRGGAAQFANSPECGLSFADFFGKVLFPGRTPSGEAAIVEASGAVRAGLEKLPEARRSVLTMRYIEGRTCDEIAELTDRTPAAVNALLYHGLRQLQGVLGPADRFLSDSPSADAYSVVGRMGQI